MAKKNSSNRKSEKFTTVWHLRSRLKRAERLGKSENYINDLKKAIEKRWGNI